MRPLYPLVAVVILLAGCAKPSPKAPHTLCFDGVYRSQVSDTPLGPAYDYLRLYPDGRVKSATLIGTPEQFWQATRRDYRHQASGHYRSDGERLTLVTRAEEVVVHYSGRPVDGGGLELDSRSLATGFEATRHYAFFPVDAARLTDPVRLRTLRPLQDGGIELRDVPLEQP